MPHSEKLLQRETLGKNRVFTHERWQVRLENGRTAEREIIRHPGGVGIVAVDENGRLLMVRQYRSGMGCEALVTFFNCSCNIFNCKWNFWNQTYTGISCKTCI